MNKNKIVVIIFAVIIPVWIFLGMFSLDFNLISESFNYYDVIALLSSEVDEEESTANPHSINDFLSLKNKMSGSNITIFDENDIFLYELYEQIGSSTNTLTLTKEEVGALLDQMVKDISFLEHIGIINSSDFKPSDFENLINVLSFDFLFVEEFEVQFDVFIRLDIEYEFEEEYNGEEELEEVTNNIYLRLLFNVCTQNEYFTVLSSSMIINETSESLTNNFLDYLKSFDEFSGYNNIPQLLSESLISIFLEMADKTNSSLSFEDNYVEFKLIIN